MVLISPSGPTLGAKAACAPVSPATFWFGESANEGSILAADHIRRAAIEVGVIPADYKGRFGVHNFRSSLSTALVAAGADVTTVQGLLRHSQVTTTLDIYAQHVPAAAMKAQETFIAAMTGSSEAASAAAP